MRLLLQTMTERAREWDATYRKGGVQGISMRLVAHLRWLLDTRRQDREFDRTFGVDTGGQIRPWRLGVRSDSVRYGHRYEPVDPAIMRRTLEAIGREFSGYTFVDLGCGKGRALVVASQYGFARLVGVEYSPRLAQVAERNGKRLTTPTQVITADASHFQFPSGNLVVFMFNPFGPEVLNAAIDHLLAARVEEGYVIYVNALHRHCLDCRSRMLPIVEDSYYGVWQVMPGK